MIPRSLSPFFVQADTKAFRQDLMNIAQTTLSSKLLTHEKNHFGLCSSARAYWGVVKFRSWDFSLNSAVVTSLSCIV